MSRDFKIKKELIRLKSIRFLLNLGLLKDDEFMDIPHDLEVIDAMIESIMAFIIKPIPIDWVEEGF